MALGLRLTAIEASLPHIGESDTYIVDQAERLIEHGLTDRYRAGWKYPHLVATVVAATSPVDVPPAVVPLDATVEEHLAAAAPLQRHTRVVTATLSSLVGPATFLIALRFLSLRFALFAALLASCSLLHICFSWQARPHGPVSGMAAVALLACIRWAERPTLPRALAMGTACSASICTLHTGAAAMGPFAVAAVAALVLHRGLRRRTLVGALLAALIVGAASGWFYKRSADGFQVEQNPEAFVLAGSERETGEGREPIKFSAVRLSGHPIPFNAFNGGGLPVARTAYWGTDPALTVLAGFGVLAALLGLRRWRERLRDPAFLCVAAFAIPTFGVLAAYSLSFPRFFLLLTAPFGLLAALGARWLLKKPIGRIPVLVATAVVFAGAGKTVWLRLHKDTFAIATETLLQEGYAERPMHVTNLSTFPLFLETRAMIPDRQYAGEPWDTYQWTLRRRAKASGAVGPAEMYGVPLHATSYIDYGRLLAGEDRAVIARELLAASSAETVLVGLNDKRSRQQMAERWDAMRDAWITVLEEDGWTRTHTIEAASNHGNYPIIHWLSFRLLMEAKRHGPTIAIYRRTL